MYKVAAALCCITVFLACPTSGLDLELNKHWELFKQTYGRAYKSQEEETLRRQVWEDNVKYVARHNREHDMGLHTFTLGINEYADMSNKEFVATMTGYRMISGTDTNSIEYLASSHATLPDSVDWRSEGYVTAVKNQLQCGSSWAFAAIGSLEGQHSKSAKKLVNLSVQNLVDCSSSEGNRGCEGGLMNQSFIYIKKNGGIDTEESYPYTGKDGRCRFKAENVGATNTGYVDIMKGSEKALQSATASVGPIAVAIDASHTSLQLYKSGVYNEPRCSTRPDHGALVVGYGISSEGQDYWIVKNSWGTTWGKKGYVWMSRNKNNQCGIATVASYPLV